MSTTTTANEASTFQSLFSSLKDFALGAVDTVATGYGAYLDKKTAYTEAEAALAAAKSNANDTPVVNDGVQTMATSTGLGIDLTSTQGLLLVGGGALVLLTLVKAFK